MAKEITTAKLDWVEKRDHWGGDNRAPYEHLLEFMCDGKTEEECKKIQKEIEGSFTYLLICERGCITPLRIIAIYEAEQKYGSVGFISELLRFYPGFVDNPISDFILD